MTGIPNAHQPGLREEIDALLEQIRNCRNPRTAAESLRYARSLRQLLDSLDGEIVVAALIGQGEADLLRPVRQEVDCVREFLNGRIAMRSEPTDLRGRALAVLDAFADQVESAAESDHDASPSLDGGDALSVGERPGSGGDPAGPGHTPDRPAPGAPDSAVTSLAPAAGHLRAAPDVDAEINAPSGAAPGGCPPGTGGSTQYGFPRAVWGPLPAGLADDLARITGLLEDVRNELATMRGHIETVTTPTRANSMNVTVTPGAHGVEDSFIRELRQERQRREK